jgi:hypothetical protein
MQKSYIVTEAEILKISEIMGCMENAVKEIIRFSQDNSEFESLRQSMFFEKMSNALLNLDADERNYF